MQEQDEAQRQQNGARPKFVRVDPIRLPATALPDALQVGGAGRGVRLVLGVGSSGVVASALTHMAWLLLLVYGGWWLVGWLVRWWSPQLAWVATHPPTHVEVVRSRD